MHNQYNNLIDKIEFSDDYKEKLMNTLANDTKNKSYHKFKRTEVGKVLIKQKIRKMSFVLVILLFAFAGLSTKPVQAAIQNLFSYIIESITHNYERKMSSYKDEINQSVTVDGITMNIYDIVMGKQEMVIRYNLIDENGNAVGMEFPGKTVVFHSMGGVYISDNNNRTIKGSVEYHDKTSLGDDLSPYLSLITFEDANVNTEEWVNCPLEISTKLAWSDSDSNPVIKSFSFNYTPTKIYNEEVVNINKRIVLDNDVITLSKLTLNGLYMKIEAEYNIDYNKKDDFFLEAVDEFGKELRSYGRRTVSTDGSALVQAAYTYEIANENVSKIYLIPCYYGLSDIDRIQLDERIEIEIPKQ
ncbi:MAG: DUF4179 domain-containing protein [Mobilitalea sp.]